MRYNATDQFILLALKHQNNKIPPHQTYPAFRLITSNIMPICVLHGRDKEGQDILAGCLALILDSEKTEEAILNDLYAYLELYKETLLKLNKKKLSESEETLSEPEERELLIHLLLFIDYLRKKIAESVITLRRLLKNDEKFYREQFTEMLSKEESAFIQQYMAFIKEILSNHVENLKERLLDWPHLNDPLYEEAVDRLEKARPKPRKSKKTEHKNSNEGLTDNENKQDAKRSGVTFAKTAPVEISATKLRQLTPRNLL